MSYPGRAWTVREENLRLRMGGDDLADSFVVVDEERVAFRVAQATLELREELAEARDFLKHYEDEWKIDPVAFDLLDKRATRYERAIERLLRRHSSATLPPCECEDCKFARKVLSD